MKLTKKLLAMALAGVMLLTILTGCSGGKTGDRLVEEYMGTFLSEIYGLGDVPITHDVPEIKTVAEMFQDSWLNPSNGRWTISNDDSSSDNERRALQNVFSNYKTGYTVILCACEVDSKQSELNQTIRVMVNSMSNGLSVYRFTTTPPTYPPISAAKCATRLVTRGDKSYRIAVIIYNHTAG